MQRLTPIVTHWKQTNSFKQTKTENKEKGLYLTGSFGSGKTYLITALFNEMAKKGIKSALIYYPELLRSLKASFKFLILFIITPFKFNKSLIQLLSTYQYLLWMFSSNYILSGI